MKVPCPRCKGEKTIPCLVCINGQKECTRCGGDGIVDLNPNLGTGTKPFRYILDNYERLKKKTPAEIRDELVKVGLYRHQDRAPNRTEQLRSVQRWLDRAVGLQKQGEKWKLK